MACRTLFLDTKPLAAPSAIRWFAVRVRSNFERTVAFSLEERGYEAFLPTYAGRRRRQGGSQNVHVPLFPGYVFGRFSPAIRLPILAIPGVVHVVSSGRTPIPVDDGEIAAIQAIVASGLRVCPWPFLAVGDALLIERGPLTGVEGTVIAIRKQYRLVASITLLQRSLSVELEREWVRPLARRSACGERVRSGQTSRTGLAISHEAQGEPEYRELDQHGSAKTKEPTSRLSSIGTGIRQAGESMLSHGRP